MSAHDIIMGAAGNSSGPVNYIDDVFSTYLYTGNGSTQTITNGIDLAGKGGMVWYKARDLNEHHMNLDTERGGQWMIGTNLTSQQYDWTGLSTTTFNNNGFSFDGNRSPNNQSGNKYTSWTFRKQPKFFDIVTYTGNSTAGREIPHNLGSAPGCIMVKAISSAGDWWVYHRSLGATQRISLNGTYAAASSINPWNNTEPTSTVFTLSAGGAGNDNGVTYVAYLFAHDAGGFGTAGTDNVISCGSYTYSGSTLSINLGYEPQWILVKNITTTEPALGNWLIFDNMRGLSATIKDALYLRPNSSGAEVDNDEVIKITATGFEIPNTPNSLVNVSGSTYIYIAIRRPMKPPTTGTEVFQPLAYSGNSVANRVYTASITPDLIINKVRNGAVTSFASSRLQGNTARLETASTSAEATGTYGYSFDANNGFKGNTVYGGLDGFNSSGYNYIANLFKRAPGFFDVVCYTGDGTNPRNITHNLTVAPELIITKNRTGTDWDWAVYQAPTYGTTGYDCMKLNTVGGANQSNSAFYPSAPTSSYFTVGNFADLLNGSGKNYVSYLFASLPGVSKVGSYTGTGAARQINCGFSGGARFVMIKRLDGNGNWYVWDTARGIVSGNDPYLFINDVSAEDTSSDFIDPYSGGFELSGEALNVSGWKYLFLAIA